MNKSSFSRSAPIADAPSISSESSETSIAAAKAVPERISVLATLSTLPEARLMFSDEPQLSPVASNWKVLSPSPESAVIPAPSAAASFAAPVDN